MRRIWCVLFAVILACSLALVCSAKETEAYTYTASNGVSFTVPANWWEHTADEDAGYTYVQFLGGTETGSTIIYSFGDWYNEGQTNGFSGLERPEGLPKELVDNSVLDKAIIAEGFGGKEQDVSMVTYAGKEYFFLTVEKKFISDVVPVTYLLRIEDGCMHVFYFQNYGDEDRFQDFEMLMSSVSYPAEAETEAYTYTTSDGVSFTVPANWSEVVDKSGEGPDVQLVYNRNAKGLIYYIMEDIYSDEYAKFSGGTTLTEEDVPREQVNNSQLDRTGIASIFNCKEEDVSMATYAGKEYFCVASDQLVPVGENSDVVPNVFMIRCANGYMYLFAFADLGDEELYQDFELLLTSVSYPDEPSSTQMSVQDYLDKYGSPPNRDVGILLKIVFGYALAIGLVPLPIAGYRYLIRKKPMSGRKAICVVVIYAIAVIFAMAFFVDSLKPGPLTSIIIFLCGYINYRILTK